MQSLDGYLQHLQDRIANTAFERQRRMLSQNPYDAQTRAMQMERARIDAAPVGSIGAPGGALPSVAGFGAPNAPVSDLLMGPALASDITGPFADAAYLWEHPEERTVANYGLSALGALPFVPSGIIRTIKHPAPENLPRTYPDDATLDYGEWHMTPDEQLPREKAFADERADLHEDAQLYSEALGLPPSRAETPQQLRVIHDAETDTLYGYPASQAQHHQMAPHVGRGFDYFDDPGIRFGYLEPGANAIEWEGEATMALEDLGLGSLEGADDIDLSGFWSDLE